MNAFLTKVAGILEVPEVKEADELKAFAQWDSLSVLSIIAMLDADYGVNVHASQFGSLKTADNLWNFIQARKRPGTGASIPQDRRPPPSAA
jgi:acyl carrier protein